jgi:ABC-type transport system involved in cytochrome bd biosynthesis fused ATPase/permease subunit
LSGRMKFAIAGVVIGLILFAVSPIAAVVVILLAIGIPTGMYLMLDPSQRRRLREQTRRRRQIGS